MYTSILRILTVALMLGVVPLLSAADDKKDKPADPPKKERTAKDYLERGELFMTRGDLDQVLADFDKAVELSPKLADAYRDRGVVHLARAAPGATRRNWTSRLPILRSRSVWTQKMPMATAGPAPISRAANSTRRWTIWTRR